MSGFTKLVSVIILSYNSDDTISRAIHSVASQDYPRIEVVVSDDHSTSFSPDWVRSVLEGCDSLERFEIVTSETNTGTVKNLKRALNVIHGDCFLVLGGDDAYADPYAISSLMTVFESRNWEPIAVTGVAEMRSEDMNEFLRYLPDDRNKAVLRRENPISLYNGLAGSCIIPIIATCFQKSFLSVVPAFDDSYALYEDYPTFLRMARLGYAPAFLDRVITLHAAGGVANGTTRGIIHRKIYDDRCKMWRREFVPYSLDLPKRVLDQNARRREAELNIYNRVREESVIRFRTKQEILLSHALFLSENLLSRGRDSAVFFMLFTLSTICSFRAFGVGPLPLLSGVGMLVSLLYCLIFVVQLVRKFFVKARRRFAR